MTGIELRNVIAAFASFFILISFKPANCLNLRNDGDTSTRTTAGRQRLIYLGNTFTLFLGILRRFSLYGNERMQIFMSNNASFDF